MKLRVSLLLFFAAPLLFVHSASAQTSGSSQSATIRGVLTDPSGAVVAGALVAARPIDSTAATVGTHSASDGTFSLALAPGKYRVSTKQPSFAQVEQEFTLVAGETQTWDVRLTLEKLSANVIVTAQAEPAEAVNVAAPVDVITRQQIEQRNEIWLTPLLASEPGASLSQLGPMGGVTSYFLDGGNSNYTKVLVDGTPVNEPGGAVDFSNFTTDDVDKIEIVHGASSALYGSDAMDGVVQIFTHRGTTRTPELDLEGDGGTFGTGHGSGQLSGMLGALDYSLGAGYFSSEGQTSPPVMGEVPTDYFRDTTLSGNFGWKFSDTDSLRLTVRNSASDAGQPGQTLFASVPFAVDPGQHTDLHDFSSGLAWNFSNGGHWQNQLSGYESRFQETEFSPPFSPFVSKFNRAGLNEQATYSFANGGVTTGYMFEVENGGAQARHNQAGYIEVRYNFRPRLSVVVGGRVEANGFFGTRAVPRVGASYALRYGHGFWGPTRLRASYGEGIKEPELFPVDCTPILKPEQSTTVDAALDQYFASDRVRFSLTYFHNDFRDIVSFAFVADPTMANCPAFGGDFFNTDKARAFGANSSLTVKATKWLGFAANYGYDDSKVLSSPNATDPALVPGNRLLKRPLNSTNATLNAHWHGANWFVGAYYISRQTDSDFLGLGITSDPGYFRLDMAASMPLRYGLSATAYFSNLLDRHYQVATGYPALGYNYRFGVKYTWGGE
ncbi:MAG: TonB-dependent receptor [Candidatus Acidiferrales bacterium]